MKANSSLRRALRFLARFRTAKSFWRALKFPGLRIVDSAELRIDGSFVYGDGCSVGAGANIIVRGQATLVLGEDCYLGRHVELGPDGTIRIGSNTSVQDRSIFLGDVAIGDHCLIAPNVYISSGRHSFDSQPSALIRDQDLYASQPGESVGTHGKPIVVGDDCWLGINAVVMPGVTIGKGAVIGANSVVTRDVVPYTVVAGAPARVVRKRLEYRPPGHISHDNPSDWPYFYDGFAISRRQIDEFSAYGGMMTERSFTFVLEVSNGSSIHIVVKAIGSGISKLVFGSQHATLAKDFQEVVFDIDTHSRETGYFHMQADPAGAKLVVREAWVR